MYKYTDCGLDGIMLKNGYDVYQTEHGEAVGIHDLEGLHKAIGMHLVQDKPTLTANEVRFLRKEMGLSQKDLADIIGFSESSMRAYERGANEAGATEIPAPAERLLRSLYLEMVDGKSEVRKLLDRLAQMNRDVYHDYFELEETDSGWTKAA